MSSTLDEAHTETTSALAIEPLTGALGARVEGVDLREPVTDAVGDELRYALAVHQVLVFQNHHDMTPEQHLAASAIFGYPGAAEPWRTFGEATGLIGREGAGIITEQPRNADIPPYTDGWHTDDSFLARPPVAGTIRCPVIPKVGGDTAWVSLHCLYEGLSPRLQALCDGLYGEHTWELMRASFVKPRGPEYEARMEATFPPIMLHPLVQAHPVTGRKYIFLGGDRKGWMPRIASRESGALHALAGLDGPRESNTDGLTFEEADWLLRYLRSMLNTIDYQFRWHWAPGDFLVWDQRTTNHYGTSDHWVHDPNRTVHSVWTYPDEPTPS